MDRLKVAPSGDFLEKDGKPFFLLSDTDWMAFQKLSVEEWRELVVRRKQQGFNALQISTACQLRTTIPAARMIFTPSS